MSKPRCPAPPCGDWLVYVTRFGVVKEAFEIIFYLL